MNEFECNNIENLIEKYKRRRNIENVLELKEELDQYFKDRFSKLQDNISISIKNNLAELKVDILDYECSELYLMQINADLYNSFTAGSSKTYLPSPGKSKIKYSLLKKSLENLYRNIEPKTTATEIIDVIEDEFEKLKQIGLS